MAIQGKYNFKGIEIDNAYIRVSHFHNVVVDHVVPVIKTEGKDATYNEDGTIKTEAVPAVYEDQWQIVNNAALIANVYQSKALRDANPVTNVIEKIDLSFTGEVKATSKNGVIQAYNHLKSLDAYKDYTDV
tara:strand:+ start:707 stop:1099 length:393 start_codon:yes stop_codon:yes gene_type:complete